MTPGSAETYAHRFDHSISGSDVCDTVLQMLSGSTPFRRLSGLTRRF